jgi:4'-phosphopantetheinyl transferase
MIMQCARNIAPTPHIWRIALRARDSAGEVDAIALDPTERDRAQAFKFDIDRRRFIRCHSAVRSILGQYCKLPPAEVRFNIDSQGKPGLPAEYEFAFNLSHSEDMALLGIVDQRLDIGVDIEKLRNLDDLDRLAGRVCTPAEQERLRQLPTAADRGRLFLEIWTRKEAYVKALGVGLLTELNRIDVGARRVGSMCIEPLQTASGSIAALALSAEIGLIKYFDYPA